MTDSSLYYVFSFPPSGVTEEDFEAFYSRHVDEILTVPGWRAGRRYKVSSAGDVGFPYNYLALYRIEGDAEEATDRLYKASGTDQIYIPEWFEQVPWLTWTSAGQGESDPLGSQSLWLSLTTEKPGSAVGDAYELTEVDTDDNLPRYRWMQIIVDGKDSPAMPEPGVLEITCAGLGALVTTSP